MAEELLERLFSVLQNQMPDQVLCRASEGPVDEKALLAWQARVLAMAE